MSLEEEPGRTWEPTQGVSESGSCRGERGRQEELAKGGGARRDGSNGTNGVAAKSGR